MARTRDAVKIMMHRVLKDDPQATDRVDRYYTDMLIAEAIYDLREEAGLTQAELAKRIGTSPSVISRLEDWQYEGHSLTMLKRIADALGKRIEFRFVDKEPLEAPAPELAATG